MIILSIETSADETGVSLVEAEGSFPTATYTLLGNGLRSQIELHNQYGGIFPMMAKREHAKALIPLLQYSLEEADLLAENSSHLSSEKIDEINKILERETDLAKDLLEFLNKYELPEINLITVTNGPGLEPALWVGVNFAKALASVLGCPVVPVNHMEGHILASIFDVVEEDQLAQIEFPAIALLISGGHTELIHMPNWGEYIKIGQTRDDAVGEAFDKVARLLGMGYPGGPEIGKRASEARTQNLPPFKANLPRPMIHSGDLDFSFSGLKTAVLYAVKDLGEVELTETQKNALSRDFEDAVTEVLLKKTKVALDTYGAKTLIIGGGVSASPHLRAIFTKELLSSNEDTEVFFPIKQLSTDNSVMIALAGHAHKEGASTAGAVKLIKADGNKSL